jgi:hypothetical protein
MSLKTDPSFDIEQIMARAMNAMLGKKRSERGQYADHVTQAFSDWMRDYAPSKARAERARKVLDHLGLLLPAPTPG